MKYKNILLAPLLALFISSAWADAASDLILSAELAALQRQTTSYAIAYQSLYMLSVEGSDIDGDGAVEAPAMTNIGGAGTPTGGGNIPLTSGAPKSDSYGKTFGYCSWDNGTVTGSAGRIAGINNPAAPTMAIIATGANGAFDTTCANLSAGQGAQSDDVVVVYSGSQLAMGVNSNLYVGTPVSNLAALNALAPSELADGQIRLTKDNNAVYRWNTATTTWQVIWQTGVFTPSRFMVSDAAGAVVSSPIAHSAGSLSGVVNLSATGNINTTGQYLSNGATVIDAAGYWQGGTVAIGKGGTGQTATPLAGQLLIGNGAGYTLSGLTGTANQIVVSSGAGAIVLSLPQNIHAAATPTFAGLILNGAMSGTTAGFTGNVSAGAFNGHGTQGGAGALLDSTNQAYAWNMNQNVRTGDSPTFATVTAATFNGYLNGNAATATTSTNLVGAGGSHIWSTSAGTGYGSSIQMREVNGAGAQGSSMDYAPRLGFHWGGVVASSLAIEASGRIGVFNNPGTAYENLVANQITATGGFVGTLSGNASTATYATSAGNSDTVDGQHFTWSNTDNNPSYVWSTNVNGTSFLANRASLSVNYASSAGSVPWSGVTGKPTTGDWAGKNTFVSEMLSWKNYGNNHVIFDASQGTSPTGSGINNANSQVPWSASYPTLMGWNGSNTYGVRVDSARIADNFNTGAGAYSSGGDVYATYHRASGGIRLGDMWGGAGLYQSSGSMVFGTENAGWVFSQGAVTKAQIGTDGNIWMQWSGQWLSTTLGEKATHRGEGSNFVDYSRYVYNNGAYSGSGWVEPSDLGVRYANTANYANSAGAAYPYRVGGVVMQFNWAGQSGQPPWLWGGSDGTNMYVYNPSNFSVNYANSAGSVGWGGVSGVPGHISGLNQWVNTDSAATFASLTVNGGVSATGTVAAGKLQVNDIVTAGTGCSPNGLMARDSVGATLSCQSGVWTKSGGSDVKNIISTGRGNSRGYTTLPSGIIIQWGEIPMGAFNYTVNFPYAFPNACLAITGNSGYATGGYQAISCTANAYSFTGNTGAPSGSGYVSFIAIGY